MHASDMNDEITFGSAPSFPIGENTYLAQGVTSIRKAESVIIQSRQQNNCFPSRVDIERCFTQEPAVYDFVIQGLVVGTIGLVTSPGGAGKSTFAMQLAASVASNTDKLGVGIEHAGSVLFLSGEDPEIVLHHRLHNLAASYDSAERALIASRCDFRCTIGLGADIMSDKWRDWIREQSKGRRLVVIDTLSRFHSLNENDASDAKKLMMRLEHIAHELNTAILVLHHVSKNAVLNGESDAPQAARGSSVFVDNARWASFLTVMTKKEAEARNIQEADRRHYVRWNINKQNYSEPIIDKWFERGVGGVLRPADFSTRSKKQKAYAYASQSSVLPRGSDDWY